MGFTVKSKDGEKSFHIAPEGTHIGRCFKIIDLGTQYNEKYDNYARKMLICFELPTELIETGELAGQPYAVTKQYTRSLGAKSNLRHDLEAWRGKKFTDEELNGFDIDVLLGKYCFINVSHSEDGKYANINSIIKLPKGAVEPPGINQCVVFDMDVFDKKIYESFSDGLKEKIMKSKEWEIMFSEPQRDEEKQEIYDGNTMLEDDDIPF